MKYYIIILCSFFCTFQCYGQRFTKLFGESNCDRVIYDFCSTVNNRLNNCEFQSDTTFYFDSKDCLELEYTLDFTSETMEGKLVWDGEEIFRFKTVGKFFIARFYDDDYIGELNWRKQKIASIQNFNVEQYDQNTEQSYKRKGIRIKLNKDVEESYIDLISKYFVFPADCRNVSK